MPVPALPNQSLAPASLTNIPLKAKVAAGDTANPSAPKFTVMFKVSGYVKDTGSQGVANVRVYCDSAIEGEINRDAPSGVSAANGYYEVIVPAGSYRLMAALDAKLAEIDAHLAEVQRRRQAILDLMAELRAGHTAGAADHA